MLGPPCLESGQLTGGPIDGQSAHGVREIGPRLAYPRGVRRDVLKFGGEALRDGAAVRRAAGLVVQESRGGCLPVVVVSAHAGVTDLLEDLARGAAEGRIQLDAVRIRHRSILAQLSLDPELLDRYWRELSALLDQISVRGELDAAALDHALSFGERLSSRIVARALESEGIQATPVDAWDLGLITDSNHGRATPLAGIAENVRRALEGVSGVPVVTGFLARDRDGRATTLGRDGSDLTAALLAEAVNAQELCYWKTVAGIMTADPRLVADARPLREVSYVEAAELASHGASVLHSSAVAPAQRAGIPIRVADVRDPSSGGTRLVPEVTRSSPISLATRSEVLCVELDPSGPQGQSLGASELEASLVRDGVAVAWMASEGNPCAVVLPGPGLPSALSCLGREASVIRDLSTVALVGQGVAGQGDAVAMAHSALADVGVRVHRSCSSDDGSSLALLVTASDLEKAVQTLHTRLVADPNTLVSLGVNSEQN